MFSIRFEKLYTLLNMCGRLREIWHPETKSSFNASLYFQFNWRLGIFLSWCLRIHLVDTWECIQIHACGAHSRSGRWSPCLRDSPYIWRMHSMPKGFARCLRDLPLTCETHLDIRRKANYITSYFQSSRAWGKVYLYIYKWSIKGSP